MRFAEWLRATRIARVPELSQEGLATMAAELEPNPPKGKYQGFSQGTVSEWERGIRLPDIRQFELLCMALRCSTAERAAGKAAWEADWLRGLPPTAGLAIAS